MIPLVNEALDSLDSQKCLSLSDLLETVEAAVDPTVTKLGVRSNLAAFTLMVMSSISFCSLQGQSLSVGRYGVGNDFTTRTRSP